MIKVFLPVEKTKENKSYIRGLWHNDKGKLFYDYLKIEKHYYNELTELKAKYKQECLQMDHDTGQNSAHNQQGTHFFATTQRLLDVHPHRSQRR